MDTRTQKAAKNYSSRHIRKGRLLLLSTSNQVLLEALQDMQNEHGLRFPDGMRPIMTMSEHFTPRLSIGYLSFKESAFNSSFVDLPVNHISMCPVVKQPHQKAPSLGPTG